ncbi:sigma factor-like helix-turn-helix DNA-binding protein [Blautia wexlerae]|uniref:sigma factor-like helix-turn-helix DNA-binding protein n=1 Tax=Blautia wexlerae TaxID=418240 RepID=UPI003D6C9C46
MHYLTVIYSCLSEPEKDDFDSCSVSLQAPDSFDDTYYDVTAYINSYPSDSVQRKILSMYFYQDKSDAQIAQKLKLSRQYVNRMKKKLILRYISENK